MAKGDDEQARLWRRNAHALMLSLAFSGGAFFGLLASALQLPAAWWAPVILLLTSGFWLWVR
jgi:hypothetical protein